MAKSEFVTAVAHEIRTTLRQVLGFLELMSETNLNAQQKDYVKYSLLLQVENKPFHPFLLTVRVKSHQETKREANTTNHTDGASSSEKEPRLVILK
jgi:signal transduction histidine kinase